MTDTDYFFYLDMAFERHIIRFLRTLVPGMTLLIKKICVTKLVKNDISHVAM